MLNRRLIRIKVFKTLYSFEFSGSDSLDGAKDAFLRSCENTRELYCFLLNITGALTRLASDRITAGMNKFHPTEEEANPNLRFVENQFNALIQGDPELGRVCQKKDLGWAEYDVFIKKLYASVIESDYYQEYMAAPSTSFEADCKLWRIIFEEEFEDNEMLESLLEDKCVNWVDDLAFVLNVIIKDIDTMARTKAVVLPSVFQKEDDKLYGTVLLEESINGYQEYSDLIYRHLDNWDSDRTVSTDMALLVMGIAEAVSFPSIPVKVTINEYVEISKFYSTAGSKSFVNGILNAIIQEKVASGEIVKTGRGLIDS